MYTKSRIATLVLVLERDAHPVVLHRELPRPVALGRAYVHLERRVAAVLERIGDEVPEHLPELDRVAVDRRQRTMTVSKMALKQYGVSAILNV